MALLVLIVMGACAGWLASIITRNERAREILRMMGVGVAGSLIGGLIVNNGTFLGGISLSAVGAAVLAAALALVVFAFATRSNTEIDA